MPVVNLLAAETPILDRLKVQLADLTELTIASIVNFVGAIEPLAQVPAIWVQPGEAKKADTRGGGTAAVDVQQWVLHHLFALVPDKANPDGTFADAGTTLARAYTALVGWAPGSGMGPLRYVARPVPDIRRGEGWADIAVVFECDVLLRT